MTITNGYATLAQIKALLRINVDDTTDDDALERAITTASRRIDARCARRFYADANASARTYTAVNGWRVDIDDVSTTTGLVVKTDDDADGIFETTWASVDYQLEPLNALAKGEPVRRIIAIGSTWPTWAAPVPVQVTAKWGWPAVPAEITDACLLLAGRLFKRQDSLLGVAGFGDLGVISVRSIDPDIEGLIAPYILPGVG